MSENRIKLDTFIPLMGEEWVGKFKPFLESEDMWNIYQRLKHDSFVRKERIVPDKENTYRAFKMTNPEKIKVVMVLMDPYPRLYSNGVPQATGIPMSCDNSPDGRLQPSLVKFFTGMSQDLGKEVEKPSSLEYLLDEGVLLLNSDLTCKVNKTSSHEKLWEPFMKFFFSEIMGGYSGIVYILAGKSSLRMKKFIYPMSNYIFEVEHPAAAEHGNRDWEHHNIFSRTNEILRQNNGPENIIHWDYREYLEYSLPF